MPQRERKNNTGVLFKNDEKNTERHPDSTGQAKIDGKEYWVSAWRNTSDDGVPYLSISFTSKEEAAKRKAERQPATALSDPRDNGGIDPADIPF